MGYDYAIRMTSCDIEVYVGNMLEGMDIGGVDEEASQARAQYLIGQALQDTYPQYTIHVGPVRGGSLHWLAIAGYPDAVAPEQIEQIASDALGETGERWMVEKTKPHTDDTVSDANETSGDKQAHKEGERTRYLVTFHCPYPHAILDEYEEVVEATNADEAVEMVLQNASSDCWEPEHAHTLISVREMEPGDQWYPA